MDFEINLKSLKIDMRNPGLEPGSLAALEPESSASANSASSAGINVLSTISYYCVIIYVCQVELSRVLIEIMRSENQELLVVVEFSH